MLEKVSVPPEKLIETAEKNIVMAERLSVPAENILDIVEQLINPNLN